MSLTVILFKISKWNKMKTNRERFLELVSKEPNNTAKRNKERIIQRAMLRESRKIAFKVLERLDELGWTQKKLAEAMEVSPQYVSKMVKGKENFTLETLVKLQQVLDIPILASYRKDVEKVSAEFKGEEQTAIVQTLGSISYNSYVSLTLKETIRKPSRFLC